MNQFVALYHVPRSQVWEGSRGRQTGHVHLHREDGSSLCGRRGWYERPAEGEPLCPRCAARRPPGWEASNQDTKP